MERERKRQVKKRIKSNTVKGAGELVEIDTIVYFLDGIRRYIITGIDVGTRFGFAYGYSHLSSRAAKDFMEKFRAVAPFKIRGVKTDNGSEFLGEFDRYLRREGIEHYFNYPRHPEGNGYVERFNRTLEEEYIEYMREELREDIEWFNRSLMRYMIWYNGERVHRGFKYKTPLGYFCEKFLKNNTQSEIIWTHTPS